MQGDVDNPSDQGPGSGVVEDMLLAVASFWVGRYPRGEVLDLLTRHFLQVDLHVANLKLAESCQLQAPGTHRNSINRSAGESYAIDLYNNLRTNLAKRRSCQGFSSLVMILVKSH